MEMTEIIKRISFIRTRASLSARELSLRIGKNENYINRLEYKKDFNPTIKTLNDIIVACGSSCEEFFYYDINEYEKDKEIIALLKNIPRSKKDSIENLLK